MSKIPQTPTLNPTHGTHSLQHLARYPFGHHLPNHGAGTYVATRGLGPSWRIMDFTMFDFLRESTKTTKYDHGMLA